MIGLADKHGKLISRCNLGLQKGRIGSACKDLNSWSKEESKEHEVDTVLIQGFALQGLWSSSRTRNMECQMKKTTYGT